MCTNYGECGASLTVSESLPLLVLLWLLVVAVSMKLNSMNIQQSHL